MSTEALGSAISGLRVAQRGLDVTANNISNASTDGYTRKILPQEALIVGEAGVGVRYGEVQRYVDQSLQRDYRIQLGLDSFYDTRQAYLSRVVAVHGATDQENNIGSKIGDLYDGFIRLSNDPNSRTLQSSVVSDAQRLAQSINDAARQFGEIRNEVQKTIKSEVDTLNESLKQIAELNKKIQTLDNTGRSSAALQDQRDVLVKNVSKQLDISYFTDGDGTLVLQTKDGHVLVDTVARGLSFTNNLLTPAALYPNGASGIIIEDASTGGYDLASKNPGGKLGALLTVRDQDIPIYAAQLDELAHKMMVRFSDQNVRLFTDTAGTVPANDPALYTGISANIRVNASIVADPSLLQTGTSGPAVNPGENTVIMNVVNYVFGRFKDASGTLNEPFLSSGVGYDRNISYSITGDPNASLEEFARSMIDGQAQDYTLAKSSYDTEHQYMQEVEKRLVDSSGVNTDEEMTKMIELQKNYAASAKMINALDQLFQDLLNAI